MPTFPKLHGRAPLFALAKKAGAAIRVSPRLADAAQATRPTCC